MPLHVESLQIVCDANIPAAEAAFGRFGRVHLLPGRAIDRAAAQEADVLLVRSVTPVTEALVGGTPVRFVGTATAGVDHVDQDALARLGIAFASAPGSNATSVVEYVIAALLELSENDGFDLMGATLGVVGAGQVGGRLVPRARALGMTVVVCDPPRGAAGFTDHDYRPLSELLEASDVVTLHTPLTDGGSWPTRGMIGAEALAAMRPFTWLINAARGPVVDGQALLAARSRLGALVLDCWPDEPSPYLELIAAADLATPHIAGYAFDGKVAGTTMLDAALRAWLLEQGTPLPPPWSPDAILTEPEPLVVTAPPLPDDSSEARTAFLAALARQAYDVRADDARFRATVGSEPDAARRAAAFAELRRTYPRRRENAAFTVRGAVPEALRRAVTDGLGMRLALGT